MRFLVLFIAIFSVSIASAATFTVETDDGNETSTSTVTIADIELEVKSLQARLDALLLSLINSERKPVSTGKNTDTWITDKIFDESIANAGSKDSETITYGAGIETYANKGGCNFEFLANYHLGDSGDEVRAVQGFLNRNSETLLTSVGAGSPGQETDYFGRVTFEAVKKFQALYGTEVLESIGLDAPTGYWGPSTRKTANRLAGCVE